MDVEKEVRHDAASLCRFIDAICAACDTGDEGRIYLPSTRSFFNYIRDLGQRTKAFLGSFPASTAASTAYNAHRQKLSVLRLSWSELHQYVKPAADAHTLGLPSPLIESLQNRFRELPGFGEKEFAVFHIDEVNYLHIIAGGIRSIADRIASTIPDAPSFPANLGLIGIPYSQSSSVFLNCLIPHEMGHFAYGERSLGTKLNLTISTRLIEAFSASGNTPDPSTAAWIVDRLESWTEEIFCDLFAIRLIGPCYSYAFIELFDLTNALDRDGNLNPLAAEPLSEFKLRHPATLFRVKQQLAMLKKLGWWSEIDASRSHYYRLLELSESLTDESFRFMWDGQQAAGVPLQAFLKVIPEIGSIVEEVTGGLDTGLSNYRKMNKAIQEYLSHGVVPSTVLVETHPGHHEKCFPEPVTILNSAYTFYLEALDRLIERIDRQDPALIADREQWTEKLEMWVMKAIEDHQLLAGQGAA